MNIESGQISQTASEDRSVSTVSIFEFEEFGQFLNGWIKARREKRPGTSYQSLADKIGTVSPSMLAMIARGERFPDRDALRDIAKVLELNERETTFADTLVARSRCRSSVKRREFDLILSRLRPPKENRIARGRALSILKSYLYTVILELVGKGDFKADPEWIQARLVPRISTCQILEVISELMEMGLMAVDHHGTFRRVDAGYIVDTNSSNEILRAYHRELIRLAYDSVEDAPVPSRLHMGQTLLFPTHKLDRARELLSEFIDRFNAEFAPIEGDEVYHFQVSLFPLTSSRDRRNNH